MPLFAVARGDGHYKSSHLHQLDSFPPLFTTIPDTSKFPEPFQHNSASLPKYIRMGATHSKPNHRYTPREYDWKKEEGGYVPYRHQNKQLKWREEERQARMEDMRSKEIAWALKQREAEAARKKRYQPIEVKKQEFRRQYDEYMATKYQ